MSPLTAFLRRVRSRTWQYALLGGLASLPLTLALYLRAPGTGWSVSGIALCALAVGYLARRHGLAGSDVGLRAGVIGAFPVLLSVVELVPFVLGLSQPAWFTLIQLVVVTLSAPLLVGFVALVGGLAGRVGGWLAERQGHPRRTADA